MLCVLRSVSERNGFRIKYFWNIIYTRKPKSGLLTAIALSSVCQQLEDRCSQAENQALQVNRLADEIERLNAALRDIAHVVVQDADVNVDVDVATAAVQHLHLSQSAAGLNGSSGGGGLAPRSPKRGGVRTSQAFAEGTISAVQASLHKYQLLLHDLQVSGTNLFRDCVHK